MTFSPAKPASPCHGCRYTATDRHPMTDSACSVTPGEVTCSRCHTNLPGSKLPDGGMTAGYYDVRGTDGWADYANPGEQYLCDSCMWADPRYIAIHGKHPVVSKPVEPPKQLGFVSVATLVSPSIRLK